MSQARMFTGVVAAISSSAVAVGSLLGAGACVTGCHSDWTGRFWIDHCQVYVPGTCLAGYLVPENQGIFCDTYSPPQVYTAYTCDNDTSCTNSCDAASCPNRADCHHTGTVDPDDCVVYAKNRRRQKCFNYY